ncbi:MAG: MarR family EPS-associated transcriptional regulator [Thiohalomonadales bacterium]
MSILSEENRYKILKLLESNPEINQRQLATTLGISLGKANYCLKAIIERGWVKADNFRKSPNKKAYAYYLTAKGIEEKAKVTLRFLQFKQNEYETIQLELEELRKEAELLQK